ncbi:hypothetical protein L1987_21183 [Smallanthus sonchifolius]|uniref:Uncharacterized protein n=1 Tax=Smallanthus sonchifolius TaxID=185202 RepID=A0ACB9IU71_9ASTR|nr:hypothetical protein L1987_21183 [Smallanthus sonchifolius]
MALGVRLGGHRFQSVGSPRHFPLVACVSRHCVVQGWRGQMVQPGKGELLSSPSSARDSMECTGDTRCSVQQGVDSLRVENLSGLVLVVVGQRCFLELPGSDLATLSP